jgi:phosphatidylinositol glycan class N
MEYGSCGALRRRAGGHRAVDGFISNLSQSSLIGVAYPVNNVGTLPISYLDNTDEYKAAALFANARGLLSQYILKAEAKAQTEFIFTPFAPLKNHTTLVTEIEASIRNKRYEDAETASAELITLAIAGLRYYQTYNPI